MNIKKNNTQNIFVDCFNTVIFRSVKRKEVFKQWAKDLEQIFNIDWKTIYKTYNKSNFKMSFIKLFTTLTLQEEFTLVLKHMHKKLVKKHRNLNLDEFIKSATEIYIQKELNCFKLNTEFVKFLQEEKLNGKNIYIVSDFYCKSNIFKHWFEKLEILNIFNNIFSSADFNKEKATTKLYKHLKSQLNLKAKDITMYGDNIWSDIFMSKICGLKANRIKINKTTKEL